MTYLPSVHLKLREAADPSFLSAYPENRKFTSDELGEVFQKFREIVPFDFVQLSLFRHHEEPPCGPKEYLHLKTTEDSLTKKVIQYAKAYYSFIGVRKFKDFDGDLDAKEQARCAAGERFYDFLDRMDGIDILEKSEVMQVNVSNQRIFINAPKDRRLIECQNFIFGNEPWFSQKMKAILLSDKGVPLLRQVGYRPIGKPQVGAVIIYFVNRKPAHFGRVVEVRENGDVIVESKFSSSHVYRHKAELVDPVYGEDVEYFQKFSG